MYFIYWQDRNKRVLYNTSSLQRKYDSKRLLSILQYIIVQKDIIWQLFQK